MLRAVGDKFLEVLGLTLSGITKTIDNLKNEFERHEREKTERYYMRYEEPKEDDSWFI